MAEAANNEGNEVETESVGIENVLWATEGDPGVVLVNGELAPLRIAGGGSGGMLAWARDAARRRTMPMDKQELAALVSAMAERKIDLPIVWPARWGPKRVTGLTPRPRLELTTPEAGRYTAGIDQLDARMKFYYDGALVDSAAGELVQLTLADGTPAMLQRDAAAEHMFTLRLINLGGKESSYDGTIRLAGKLLPGIAAALLSEGWEVVRDAAAFRKSGQVSVRMSSGIDWFDLEGAAEFGETSASIGTVLAALQKGDKFVKLGDGTLGLLPEEWLKRYGRWLGLGKTEGDAVRFRRSQLSLVDALMAEMPEATCDAQLAAARQKLRAFDGIVARTEPKSFAGELRPYQRQGLGWLHFLAEFGFGGCLADDMGLGKTVQLLAHLADTRGLAGASNARQGEAGRGKASIDKADAGKLSGGKASIKKVGKKKSNQAAAGAAGTPADPDAGRGPWLVVAPKSLVLNWAKEAARFTPQLVVVDYTGIERTAVADKLAGADLVLTTYATMRRDIEKLREIEFGCVVLDEAQMIKNGTSQAAKAAMLLRARRRLALTGTPVENRLEDLWSIFEFLNPGMLGSTAAFAKTAKAGQDEGGMETLRRALRPFLLRRTKANVAPELPARSEQTVRCELDGKQKKLYEGLRTHYQQQLLGQVDRDGMNKSKMHVLEALLRLRQAACHPALIEPKRLPALPGGKKAKTQPVESAKLDTLMEMLQELAQEGHKALVFSQFTSLLSLVKTALDKKKIAYEELDGTTSAKHRAEAVERFQSKPVKDGGRGVFLISLKAGGVGLNLTAAGYVFLLDPWWNPAVEAQAIDRAHRIGQDKSVIAYRLIATGTVEERIMELQERKRELATAIVSENAGPLSSMTRDDLEWLLS